jgi:TonB-dependent receptor-like protein
LKFGGGFRNLQQPHVPVLFGRGQFVFQGFATGNAVADFLLGNPFLSIGAGKRPISYMSFHYYDAFMQDDWKVAPRLTLNFGLRYERVGVVTDRYRGRLGVFNEATGQVVTGTNVDQAGLVNPDNLGFQPRFGFSWQPFSTPQTVIRGGYGVYNDVKVINERNFSLGTELGWQQIVDVNPLLGQPPGVSWDNLFPVAPTVGVGILSDDPFARDPYVQMWSLGIQRELPFDAVLEVGYVGQAGHKLSTRLDINQARLPSVPNEPLPPRRPYPTQGSVLMSKNLANSNYNGLQIRFEKRYSHNLSFLSAYTFSKSFDNASSTCDVTSCNSAQNNRDLGAEYGPSSFDQRHRFVFSPIYLFPFGSGQRYLSNLPRGVNAVVKGWQASTIVTFASGTPFPVQVTGVDRTQTGTFGGGKQYANCVGPGMLPSGDRTVERDFNTSAFQVAPLGTWGNCGRDILTSRGTNNWDISLLKDTVLTEKTTLQFRTEFFNTWNHPQFGIPVFDPTSQAFGRITSVRPAREIQFALKLLF